MQTYEDMIVVGASPKEAKAALKLFLVLKPSLKIDIRGRIFLGEGYSTKTILGMYRVIKDVVNKE